MAASLLGIGLLLGGSRVWAQQQQPDSPAALAAPAFTQDLGATHSANPSAPEPPATILRFGKDAHNDATAPAVPRQLPADVQHLTYTKDVPAPSGLRQPSADAQHLTYTKARGSPAGKDAPAPSGPRQLPVDVQHLTFTKDPGTPLGKDGPAPSGPHQSAADVQHLTYTKDSGTPATALPTLRFGKEATPAAAVAVPASFPVSGAAVASPTQAAPPAPFVWQPEPQALPVSTAVPLPAAPVLQSAGTAPAPVARLVLEAPPGYTPAPGEPLTPSMLMPVPPTQPASVIAVPLPPAAPIIISATQLPTTTATDSAPMALTQPVASAPTPLPPAAPTIISATQLPTTPGATDSVPTAPTQPVATAPAPLPPAVLTASTATPLPTTTPVATVSVPMALTQPVATAPAPLPPAALTASTSTQLPTPVPSAWTPTQPISTASAPPTMPPPLFAQRNQVTQKEKESTRLPTEPSDEYNIQLDPPGRQRLFKLESEAAFFERMRQDARQRPTPERIEFPAEPVVSTQQVFAGRYFPPLNEVVEPAYVCYGRLLFEVKNIDRYGWDLGPLTPFVDAGMFYFDVATLPYHAFTDPCRKFECNAGYCLPGDPVPFMLYPPGLSITGLLAETGAIVALPFLMP